MTTASRNAINIAVLSVYKTLFGPAQADRVLHQAVQDRLKVERRTADDLEDLGSGRLLLLRLSEKPLRFGKLSGPLVKLPL